MWLQVTSLRSLPLRACGLCRCVSGSARAVCVRGVCVVLTLPRPCPPSAPASWTRPRHARPSLAPSADSFSHPPQNSPIRSESRRIQHSNPRVSLFSWSESVCPARSTATEASGKEDTPAQPSAGIHGQGFTSVQHVGVSVSKSRQHVGVSVSKSCSCCRVARCLLSALRVSSQLSALMMRTRFIMENGFDSHGPEGTPFVSP
eukprot:3685416-Rhodomonas_salina.1